MNRIPMAAAVVPWLVWSMGLSGCAHGQRGEYHAQISALDAAKPRRGSGDGQLEEPLIVPQRRPR